MSPPDEIDTLNRLLVILNRSLAVYLQDTSPWARGGTEKGRDVLAALAADQNRYAERIARIIYARGGRLATGHFPTEFTSTHDLALAFLVKKVFDRHTRDVEAIKNCAYDLVRIPALGSLAEEVLGNQREHLRAMEELLAEDEFAR